MVSITEDILKAAQISETELRQEIAMLLYQKGLPLMRAWVGVWATSVAIALSGLPVILYQSCTMEDWHCVREFIEGEAQIMADQDMKRYNRTSPRSKNK